VLDLVLVFVGFGLVPDLRAFHPFHPIANSTLFTGPLANTIYKYMKGKLNKFQAELVQNELACWAEGNIAFSLRWTECFLIEVQVLTRETSHTSRVSLALDPPKKKKKKKKAKSE
jgi:hypothetical protein